MPVAYKLTETALWSLGALIVLDSTMDQCMELSLRTMSITSFVIAQQDGIFPQENAKCYTARSVRASLEDHEDEFAVLPCPINSPKLNPIVNIWDHLDRVVLSMDPQHITSGNWGPQGSVSLCARPSTSFALYLLVDPRSGPHIMDILDFDM